MPRLPIAPPIESRDGTVTKDGLCKNMLVEQDETAVYAAVRPAIELREARSGNGNGVTEFNGKLIALFGSTLAHSDPAVTIGTLEDKFCDFAQSTI